MLSAGAATSIGNDDLETPLHLAIVPSDGNRIIEQLLCAGANPNVKEQDGRTPLHDGKFWQPFYPNLNVLQLASMAMSQRCQY